MKTPAILALWFSLMSLTVPGGEMNSLDGYQWNNRLILVQAVPETEGAADTLRAERAEIDDRNIIWFVNTGSGLISNQATASGGVERDVIELLEKASSDDRVLLIGKDGGIKSREPSLNLDEIFQRIDAMPMRIREMRAGESVR